MITSWMLIELGNIRIYYVSPHRFILMGGGLLHAQREGCVRNHREKYKQLEADTVIMPSQPKEHVGLLAAERGKDSAYSKGPQPHSHLEFGFYFLEM